MVFQKVELITGDDSFTRSFSSTPLRTYFFLLAAAAEWFGGRYL